MLRDVNKWRSTHPNRPWDLDAFAQHIRKIRRMVEDDVFEHYSWHHDKDALLDKCYGYLFGAIRKFSKEVHVFTTNYDRAIEEYCSSEDRKCRCIDGFNYDAYSKKRKWDGNYAHPIEDGITNVCLRKLHGSLTWKRHKVYGIVETGEERRSTDSNYIENMLVYPTLSPKDGQEIEPYSKIRDEFKRLMDAADICVVIGFSFRDDHINSIFSEFYNRGKPIIVVSPSANKNFYGNLLKKEIPKPEGTSLLPKNNNIVALWMEDRRLITLNHPIEEENVEDISSLISLLITNLASGENDARTDLDE